MIDLTAMLKQADIPRNAVSDEEFKIRCRINDAKAVDIMVTEDIGEDGWGGGVSSDAVAETLAANPTADVNVRINSPGGLAYDGLRIYNMLIAHEGHVTTVNEGLAYSAASIIFMAGDTRRAFSSSDFGIHRAQGGGMGTQFMMLSIAEFLDGLDAHMIDIYSERSGNTTDQVTKWLDGDTQGVMGTMFSGRNAVESGFATETAGATAKAETEQRAASVERVRSSQAAWNQRIKPAMAQRKSNAEILKEILPI